MPFYEYECQSCKYYTEVMQKITDAPLRKCPSCGRNALKKLVSAPVFRLKGSGWYETDFKSDQEKKRNLAAAEKEDSKPESKPEAKEESKASPPAKTESAPAAASSRPAEVKTRRTGGGTGKGSTRPASRGKVGAGTRAKPRPKRAAARKGRR